MEFLVSSSPVKNAHEMQDDEENDMLRVDDVHNEVDAAILNEKVQGEEVQ